MYTIVVIQLFHSLAVSKFSINKKLIVFVASSSICTKLTTCSSGFCLYDIANWNAYISIFYLTKNILFFAHNSFILYLFVESSITYP